MNLTNKLSGKMEQKIILNPDLKKLILSYKGFEESNKDVFSSSDVYQYYRQMRGKSYDITWTDAKILEDWEVSCRKFLSMRESHAVNNSQILGDRVDLQTKIEKEIKALFNKKLVLERYGEYHYYVNVDAIDISWNDAFYQEPMISLAGIKVTEHHGFVSVEIENGIRFKLMQLACQDESITSEDEYYFADNKDLASVFGVGSAFNEYLAALGYRP